MKTQKVDMSWSVDTRSIYKEQKVNNNSEEKKCVCYRNATMRSLNFLLLRLLGRSLVKFFLYNLLAFLLTNK